MGERSGAGANRRAANAFVLLALTLAVWGASAQAAGAAPVATRGLEAEQLSGSFGVRPLPGVAGVADASGSADAYGVFGSEVIALGRRSVARARLQLLASRRIELTVAGGCAPQARVLLSLDGRRIARLRAGARTLHVVGVSLHLAAGPHTIALRAVLLRRVTRACAAPLIDRIDFLPASPAGEVMLGTAMRAYELERDSTYQSLFLRYFDSLTPENELKMAYVEPQQGKFDFGPSDQLIDFAAANGKQVRGHTLVYGQQLPDWVTDPLLPWTPTALLRVMRTYIDTVMGRYASEVSTWDVVNEAFTSDGEYRHNVFYDVIGPSYIADAFRYAHAADPQAQLFYNDTDLTGPGPKADAVLAMVRDFQRTGVPIDGIGFENHTYVPDAPSEGELQGMLAQFASLGMRVEITEMSVGTEYFPGTLAQQEQAQAQAYGADATACWDIAACQRLTVWGLYDGLSWPPDGTSPLLFDADFQPKPAFYAVEQALHRGPWAG